MIVIGKKSVLVIVIVTIFVMQYYQKFLNNDIHPKAAIPLKFFTFDY